MATDQTWRYTPKRMIFGTQYEDVASIRAEPDGNRILVTFTALSGLTRYRTFDAATITSRLRMAVRGIDPRDEVLMAWPPVPTSDRAGLS